MTIIWEVIAFLAALVGGVLVLTSIGPDYSAPQTAAQAVVGIGIAAIPYFIASMAQRSAVIRHLKRETKLDEIAGRDSQFTKQIKDFFVGKD